MKDIPCIIEKDLPEELIQKRIIKDNKTYGAFDFDILANEWDIDVLIDCGFDASELIGSIDDDKESEPDSKGTKAKNKAKCPKCGHEFSND